MNIKLKNINCPQRSGIDIECEQCALEIAARKFFNISDLQDCGNSFKSEEKLSEAYNSSRYKGKKLIEVSYGDFMNNFTSEDKRLFIYFLSKGKETFSFIEYVTEEFEL